MTAKEAKAEPIYDISVFINCPFDSQFRPLFDAIVFAIHDAGFVLVHLSKEAAQRKYAFRKYYVSSANVVTVSTIFLAPSLI